MGMLLTTPMIFIGAGLMIYAYRRNVAERQSGGSEGVMRQYLDFLRHIRQHGARKDDRTGTGTLSVFGYQMRFDLAAGFPLVTTKKLHLPSIIHELLWFLSGDTNVRYLREHGVSIWDEWADKDGNLGPVYGKQWRSWPTADGRYIDQLARVVEQLKSNPNSRRILVSAWNVGELDQMALLPCHALFQFYVAERPPVLPAVPAQRRRPARRALQHRVLRLADAHAGAAVQTRVGDFVWTGGDCHLYLNHLQQADLQLSREPFPLPRLKLRRNAAQLVRIHLRGFRNPRLSISPSNQGPHRRMKNPPAAAALPCSKCDIPPSMATACSPRGASARARPSSSISATA